MECELFRCAERGIRMVKLKGFMKGDGVAVSLHSTRLESDCDAGDIWIQLY